MNSLNHRSTYRFIHSQIDSPKFTNEVFIKIKSLSFFSLHLTDCLFIHGKKNRFVSIEFPERHLFFDLIYYGINHERHRFAYIPVDNVMKRLLFLLIRSDNFTKRCSFTLIGEGDGFYLLNPLLIVRSYHNREKIAQGV